MKAPNGSTLELLNGFKITINKDEVRAIYPLEYVQVITWWKPLKEKQRKGKNKIYVQYFSYQMMFNLCSNTTYYLEILADV